MLKKGRNRYPNSKTNKTLHLSVFFLFLSSLVQGSIQFSVSYSDFTLRNKIFIMNFLIGSQAILLSLGFVFLAMALTKNTISLEDSSKEKRLRLKVPFFSYSINDESIFYSFSNDASKW